MIKNPSPTPPHKGEGLTRSTHLLSIASFDSSQTFLQGRTAQQVKSLSLVARGWGGVFLSNELGAVR